MANGKTISIGFKFENGEDGFRKLTMSADDLRKAMQSTVRQSEHLQKNLINFSALSSTFDALSNGIRDFQAAVQDLTSAYALQMEAETKLEQVMRNTMNARDEDIQSIKDFCSAQQQIGIVGDEVQLAGAQELATYLELKGSLKTLIPVMNDMVAQQYGYNHTAENAASIATMLGKVMNGQTSALSRLGYQFDDAQEKVLKFGTESERAAVLAEVVGQSVGGMNAKLAQTDTGRMKQLENTLGDMKEKLGGFAQGIAPILTIGANATIALSGVMKLANGLKVLKAALTGAQQASGALGLAVTAIAAAVTYFITRTDEAADSVRKLTDTERISARASEMAADAAEAEADARRGALSSIESNIARLKEFNGTKEEERKLVKEMNDAYGGAMGCYSTVAEWYDKLIKDSKKYCDQIVAEARIRKNADQIAELEMKRDALLKDEYGNTRKYSNEKKATGKASDWEEYTDGNGNRRARFVGESDLDRATAAVNNYNKQIEALKGNMSQAVAVSSCLKKELFTGTDTPSPSGSGNSGSSKSAPEALQGSIGFVENQIKDIQRKITFSTDPDEISRLTQERLRLEKELGVLRLPIVIEEGKADMRDMADKFKADPIPVDVELNLPDTLEGLGLSDANKEMAALVSKGIRMKGMAKSMEDFADAAKLAGQTFSSLGQAFEQPALDVAGIIAGAIANIAAGYAAATTQAASMGPWAWAAFALTGVAEMAAVIAQIKSATAFANGGIVSGPTYALVGEYAGASNNPEVIAPLNKLKSILGETSVDTGAVIIGGTIKADGRTLSLVLENQSRAAAKSGRRLKI